MDECSCDDMDGMVDESDDRTSLRDSAGVCIAFLRLGKGNSIGEIPSFSLYALVSR